MTEVNLNQIIIFLTSKFVAEVIFCVCEHCEICALNIVVQLNFYYIFLINVATVYIIL